MRFVLVALTLGFANLSLYSQIKINEYLKDHHDYPLDGVNIIRKETQNGPGTATVIYGFLDFKTEEDSVSLINEYAYFKTQGVSCYKNSIVTYYLEEGPNNPNTLNETIVDAVDKLEPMRKLRLVPQLAVIGGTNLSKINFGSSIYTDLSKSSFGWQAGITFGSLKFGPISLQSGIIVCKKGTRIRYWAENGYYRIWYLEFPLMIKGNIDLNNKSIWIGMGPTCNKALAGELYLETLSASRQIFLEHHSLRFSHNPYYDEYYNWDYGLNFEAGIIFHSILVSIQYEYGLRNVGVEYVVKNRMGALNIGYVFQKKKDARKIKS